MANSEENTNQNETPEQGANPQELGTTQGQQGPQGDTGGIGGNSLPPEDEERPA